MFVPSSRADAIRRRLARAALSVAGVLAVVAGVAVVAEPAAAAGGSGLVTESFTGSSVADSRWIALGDACLTASTTTAASQQLGKCSKTNRAPTTGATPGYLQLTDVSGSATGAVLYDRALPSSAGIQVDFEQDQYGGNGADGIGFFLTDGDYSLTNPGPTGGALGYAATGGAAGVAHGYFGLGLDAFGNYSNQPAFGGSGCTTSHAATANSIALRGPGNGTVGYCLLATKTATSVQTGASIRAAALASAKRLVRVVVSPTTATQPDPTVTYSVDFTGTGNSYQTVDSVTMPTAAPDTFKFGFTASTGGSNDVHLVRQVSVSTVNPLNALSLVKSVDHTSTGTQKTRFTTGDVVPFQFNVTNSGSSTLTGVTVNDPLISSISCPATTISPANSIRCTGTYTVTRQDAQNGTFSNTATATGSNSDGTVTASDSTTVNTYVAALTVQKTASPSTITAAGQRISYSFTVSNTGTADVTGVAVAETQFSGTGTAPSPTCPSTTLAAGASEICTASYTSTQADVEAGEIDNTARASAAVDTTTITSPTSSASVTATALPALTLTKTATGGPITTVGQQISYSFVARNTGNVALSQLSIAESSFSGTGTLGTPSCPATALAVGASTTCTASYTTTQADVDGGQSLVNRAVATAKTAAGATVTSNGSTATVAVTQTPGVGLVQTAMPSRVTGAGQPVAFSFVVANTGNVSLTGVQVTGSAFTGTGTFGNITCPSTTLAVGASEVCTATYTATQSDVDKGGFAITGVASADPPNSAPAVTSRTRTTTVPADRSPALTVSKTVTPNQVTGAGKQVRYSFVILNTGNVTLTNAAIDDSAFSGSGTLGTVTCGSGAASLAPNDSATCTADYTTTQTDADAGSVTNSATASATTPAPGSTTVHSAADSATVTIPSTPSLHLAASASPATVDAAAQTVTYTYTLQNTGNRTLTDPTIREDSFTGSGSLGTVTCQSGDLAPGTTKTCTVAYAVTQADVDAGSFSDTATAFAGTGTGSGSGSGSGTNIASNSDTAVVTAVSEPALSLEKTVSPATATTAGTGATYSFAVTNSGNRTVQDVAITEGAFTGTGTLSAVTCPTGSLAPQASTTCTATYSLTQDDIDAGTVTNAAVATAAVPGSTTRVRSASDDAVITVTNGPALSLSKTVSSSPVSQAGDSVTYSFKVVNAGNRTVRGVSIAEGTFSGTGGRPVATCPTTTIAPGVATTCTASYTLTQADVDAGGVSNTATASGIPAGGTAPIVSPADSASVVIADGSALALVETITSAAPKRAGDTVTYSFEVTNSGNRTVDGVAVDESAFGGEGTAPAVTCPVTTLAPGAHVTCTASYAVTQADVDAGSVSNPAIATGTAARRTTPVDSAPDTATAVIVDAAALSLAETVSPGSVTQAGQTVTFSFAVTNSGNRTLQGVAITPGDFTGTGTLSSIDCPAGSLAPGDTTVCTATYAVTQADVDAGSVKSTATATASSPTGPVASAADSATVTTADAPALTLVKQATPTTVTAAGQPLTYTFAVTNSGDRTVHDVVVDEGDFTGTGDLSKVDCPDVDLAPAATTTCTATYTTTQADIDAGTLKNTATADAITAGSGDRVRSAPSSATVPVDASSSLSLVKSADPSTAADFTVGRTITYSFVVTNTGTTIVRHVTIDEGAFSGTGALGGVDCPDAAGSLAPGEQTICTADYTLTQADVDAGHVSNTAVATGDGADGTVRSGASSAGVPVQGQPGIAVSKTVTPGSYAKAGDELHYRFRVSDTGNTSIAHIDIDESAFGGSGDLGAIRCPTRSLVPGQRTDCTADYTVTQDDIDAGGVTNTATASAQAAGGDGRTTSEPSTAKATAAARSAIALVKTGTGVDVDHDGRISVGDRISWAIVVKNTGSTTVTGIAVRDPSAGKAVCPATRLKPGKDFVCAVPEHRITAADVAARTVKNVATVSADGVEGPVTTDPAHATVPVTVSAPAGGSSSHGGGTLAFTGERIWPQLALGFLILLAGAAVLITRRRIRRRA